MEEGHSSTLFCKWTGDRIQTFANSGSGDKQLRYNAPSNLLFGATGKQEKQGPQKAP
ncbi:hypothetical protein QQM79_19460 [Marinobacteraceae bacterium S3BR75-40.1]